MGYRLGVDLGTTFTSAAVYTTGWPSMVPLGRQAMQIPSVLFLKPDNDFLVGDAAELAGTAQPDRIVREFKTRIGDQVPILVAGSPHSAHALQARLLSWVVEQTTQAQGSPAASITLTYPANWGPYKQELLAQTIRMADITEAETCTEPEAAASLYAARNVLSEGESVAVYDLGGGTFDVAVLRKTAGGFELLGRPDGLDHLGGIEFDEAVFRHVLAGLDVDFDHARFDPDLLPALARLRRDCVSAKEALSSDTETVIPVGLPGRSTSVRLVREEFEDLIRPALGETIDTMRRAIESAELEASDLTSIVLTGGSSRIPLVSQLLGQAFGRPIALDTHPKHDIALGAALHNGPRPTSPVSGASAAGGVLPVATTPSENTDQTDGPDDHDRATPPPPSTPPATKRRSSRRPRRAQRRAGESRPLLARPMSLAGLAVLAIVVASAVILVIRSNHHAADGGSGTITTRTPTSPVKSTTPTKNTPPPVAPLPSDALLLTTRTKAGKFQILRVDVGSHPLVKQPVQVTGLPDGQHPWLPTIGPDRTSFVYLTGAKSAELLQPWIKPLDGAAQPLLTPSSPCQTSGRPAFSPDGKQLAIICLDTSVHKMSLLVIDLSGNLVQALLQDGTPSGNPTWTNDGRIIFQRTAGTDQPQKLWSIADDGSQTAPTQLSFNAGWDSHEDWSNITGKLLFLRTVGAEGGGTIYVSGADGQAFTPLAGLTNVQAPCWSPDGTQIAFLRTVDNHLRLWVMDADGSHQQQIDAAKIKPGPPAWDSR